MIHHMLICRFKPHHFVLIVMDGGDAWQRGDIVGSFRTRKKAVYYCQQEFPVARLIGTEGKSNWPNDTHR